jgi:hypothetical protein
MFVRLTVNNDKGDLRLYFDFKMLSLRSNQFIILSNGTENKNLSDYDKIQSKRKKFSLWDCCFKMVFHEGLFKGALKPF